MTEHGITTTKSKFWMHLLVPDKRVYWYRVIDCLTYIKDQPLRLTNGKSKDGTVTGRGYLILKNREFIRWQSVPAHYFNDFVFDCDRALGLAGAEVIRKFWLDQQYDVQEINTRKAQFEDVYDVVINGDLTELKTENKITSNLFVQRWEGGHQPLIGGANIQMPPLE